MNSYKQKKTKPEYIIDPTLEKRKLDGYYFMHFFCSNCSRPTGLYDGAIDVMIFEGKSVKDVGILICPNCKNLSLKSNI